MKKYICDLFLLGKCISIHCAHSEPHEHKPKHFSCGYGRCLSLEKYAMCIPHNPEQTSKPDWEI